MTTLSDKQLHDLARLGAMARLREIEQEAAAIRRTFPGLAKAQETGPEVTPAPASKPRRRKGRMISQAARKAHSEKMKAYWARRRGEAPAGPSAPEGAEGALPADATAAPAAKANRIPKAKAKAARKAKRGRKRSVRKAAKKAVKAKVAKSES